MVRIVPRLGGGWSVGGFKNATTLFASERVSRRFTAVSSRVAIHVDATVLSMFLLLGAWSQSSRNLGPCRATGTATRRAQQHMVLTPGSPRGTA